MNKTTILNSFNDHFFEFIDDIINIIENNKEIKTARVFCSKTVCVHGKSNCAYE